MYTVHGLIISKRYAESLKNLGLSNSLHLFQCAHQNICTFSTKREDDTETYLALFVPQPGQAVLCSQIGVSYSTILEMVFLQYFYPLTRTTIFEKNCLNKIKALE